MIKRFRFLSRTTWFLPTSLCACFPMRPGIPRTVEEIEAHMKKPSVIQILKKANINSVPGYLIT